MIIYVPGMGAQVLLHFKDNKGRRHQIGVDRPNTIIDLMRDGKL